MNNNEQNDNNFFDEIMDKMEKGGYLIKIFTISRTGKSKAPIRARTTPTSDEELEDLLFKKGVKDIGYYYVILYDYDTRQKITEGQLWLNPMRDKEEEKTTIAGDNINSKSSNDAMKMYQLGADTTMNLVEKLQKMNNDSLNRFVEMSKEQREQTKEQLEELKKLYAKKEREEKKGDDGGNVLGTLAQFMPMLQNLAKTTNNNKDYYVMIE